MTFGERLRAARRKLGLTQEQFGFALGVTNSAVSAWESGRDVPSFQILPKLREVAKLSLDELVCGIGGTHSGIDVPNGMAVAENSAGYVVSPRNAARDSKEDALLARFRALTPSKRSAILELLKPGG